MRLTNDMRNAVLLRLLDKKFKNQQTAIKEDLYNMAETIYNTAYPPPARELMDQLDSGWLPTNNAVRVDVGGRHETWQLRSARTVPHINYHGTDLVLSPMDKLAKDMRKLKQRRGTLEQERSGLSFKIQSALRSVNTMKQLLDMWPEVEPYLPTEAKPQLPAVQTKALNKALGLT